MSRVSVFKSRNRLLRGSVRRLIRSRHPNFRPVDVKIGPDGAVYVAGWYNSIINHAQHDFRDHDHGRIWRITHKDRPLVKKPKLVGISIELLIDLLKSPEAVLSAGFIPRAEAFVAALHSLDHPGDATLDRALPQTMKALESYWRGAMETGKLQFAKPSHRDFAEQGVGIGLEGRLAEFLKEKSPGDKDIADIQAQLLEVGTDTEVRMIVTAMSRGGGLESSAATIAMLETLHRMAKTDASKSVKRVFRGLRKLVSNENESMSAESYRQRIIRLARRCSRVVSSTCCPEGHRELSQGRLEDHRRQLQGVSNGWRLPRAADRKLPRASHVRCRDRRHRRFFGCHADASGDRKSDFARCNAGWSQFLAPVHRPDGKPTRVDLSVLLPKASKTPPRSTALAIPTSSGRRINTTNFTRTENSYR